MTTAAEYPDSDAAKSDDDQKQNPSSWGSFAVAGIAAIVMLEIMKNYCQYTPAYMGGVVALVNGVILTLSANRSYRASDE
jgi:hypothetical protein